MRRLNATNSNQTDLIRRGLGALDSENTRLARFHFEEAAGYERTPIVLSCLGYCLAREEEDMESAFALCREAVGGSPGTLSIISTSAGFSSWTVRRTWRSWHSARA